jgi:tetratricopeptide (TPR) repeat protein
MRKSIIKVISILTFLFLVLTLNSFGDSIKQNAPQKDFNKKQEETLKQSPKTKDEKIITHEPIQELTSFSNAIEIYRDTIIFLEWILGFIIALLIGFGIFIWVRYKSFEKKTRTEISEFQQKAREEIEELKKRIEEETNKIEITGKIFIGIAQINFGKTLDAIPYLEGALRNREFLNVEQLLIIHFALGNIYCDFGNFLAAKYHSTEAIKLNPNLSIIRLLMSRTLQLAGDNQDALEEIKLAEKLSINENAPPGVLSRIYISHGNLLTQLKKYEEAKNIFEETKKKIEQTMLSIPIESPQWFTYNQIKIDIENGIKYLKIRELLQEKFESEPTQKDITEVLSWMKLLPFVYTVEQVKQIFEDKEFITLLKEVFDEVLQRPPLIWEIIRFGDKCLSKKQESKTLNEIIKEELEKYPEFIQKKEREEKYQRLLKKG